MNYDALFGVSITQFLLGFVRASGMVLTAPLYQNKTVPASIKALLSVMLGLVVAPYVKCDFDLQSVDFWMAVSFLIQEVLVGMIIGYIVNMTFLSFQLAGHFFDVPIGFSMVNVLDQQSGTEVPLLAQFNMILVSLVYMAMRGHHVLLVSFIQSYDVVGVGELLIRRSATGVFLKIFADLFFLAFKIGMPIVATIFLVDILLGVISKLIPQINVFIVGFPVKIFIGLLVLFIFIPVYVTLIETCFAVNGSAFKDLRLMLQQLTG